MSAFNGLKEFASRVAEARRRRATRRIVESLPAHLRKDIGWPHSRLSGDWACATRAGWQRPALFF